MRISDWSSDVCSSDLLAQDRHAMMHRLAVDDVEIIAELPEEARREVIVYDLGFLKAEDVGLLFAQEALDKLKPDEAGVDDLGGDFQFLGRCRHEIGRASCRARECWYA